MVASSSMTAIRRFSIAPSVGDEGGGGFKES